MAPGDTAQSDDDAASERPASTMALQDTVRSDDDTASQSSLDSFETDDSYMIERPYTRPGWLQHHPAQDTNFDSANSRADPSTWAVYKDLVILDANSNETAAPWIRLLRIKAGEPDQPIQCKLLKHQLWEDREYYALSWSWGQDPRSKTIYLNCSQLPFAVSDHLWAALHKLRNAYIDTTVWVDAICIDQENFVERAAQVGIMAQIYNGASKVMVWIGHSDTDQKSALERFWSLCREPCPWWTRLWVVQECAYARECPVLMIDDERVSMNDFITSLDHEMALERSLEDTLTARNEALSNNIELLRMPFEVWKTANDENKHCMPLLERLRQTSGRECKDPRDRIYALLGLIDSSEARCIVPDYRKPYSELLLEVAEVLDHYPYSNAGCGSALYELIENEGLMRTIRERRNWLHEHNAPLATVLQAKHRTISQSIRLVVTDASVLHVVKMILESYPSPLSAKILLYAAWKQFGIVELFKLWLEHDVEAHFQEALYFAAKSNRAVVVGLLLDLGVDPNGTSIRPSNLTPLYAASDNGSVEVVKLLLEHGADANSTSAPDENSTALSAAVRHQHLKIVQL
ncbi:unnamed protein product [Zymoseptoria tritici ST99CH_3D1]|nr:unnamed protein product [Zymoseptoria tritici ST99CH_3D1]